MMSKLKAVNPHLEDICIYSFFFKFAVLEYIMINEIHFSLDRIHTLFDGLTQRKRIFCDLRGVLDAKIMLLCYAAKGNFLF